MKNGPFKIKQLLEELEAGKLTETQFMLKVSQAANHFHAKLRHSQSDLGLASRMGHAKKVTHRNRVAAH